MVSNEWDKHWSNEILSLNSFFKFYRKYVMSNALSFFFEKYFPKKGMFVELGHGDFFDLATAGLEQERHQIMDHRTRGWRLSETQRQRVSFGDTHQEGQRRSP